MIPNNITKQDVEEAIKELDNVGWPPNRRSTKYDLVVNTKEYPPKEVLRRANNIRNGSELCTHHGGEETNGYLIKLGFVIVDKSGNKVGE